MVSFLSRISARVRRRKGRQTQLVPQLACCPALCMEVYAEGDLYISPQIAATGCWEPFETELVQRMLRPRDVFVDIGANIGWYTIVAAASVGHAGRVHAFEPARDNFELATRNVRLNRLRNVELQNAAVADRAGRANLFLANENLGDHRLYASAQQRETESVRVHALGDYFAVRPGPIRLIKMDTQGSEARIFAGIPKSLVAERDIAGFIVEYWPFGLATSGSSADALVDQLAAFDLQCYVIQEDFRGLDPISFKALRARAAGDLRPETEMFSNLLALPASRPLPDWLTPLIRSPDAPLFHREP